MSKSFHRHVSARKPNSRRALSSWEEAFYYAQSSIKCATSTQKMISHAWLWYYEMQVLMGPFYKSKSLNCSNGLSACLKAATLIQWACFGSKMCSVIQTAIALSLSYRVFKCSALFGKTSTVFCQAMASLCRTQKDLLMIDPNKSKFITKLRRGVFRRSRMSQDCIWTEVPG